MYQILINNRRANDANEVILLHQTNSYLNHVLKPEAYSQPSKTCLIEIFKNVVNNKRPLANFTDFLSQIVDMTLNAFLKAVD